MLNERQIERLVASSRSRSGVPWRWFMLLILILLVVSAALLPTQASGEPKWLRLALPWVFLLALGGLLLGWFARQSRAIQRSRLAIEALQLEDWDLAEPQLVAWLSHAVNPPAARAQGLLALGTLANRQRVYAGAATAFGALADDPLHDGFSRALGRIGLAEACLRLDRLTDAVNLLSSLRQLTLPEFARARLELVCLFQEVSMGHADDAVESIEKRAEVFRRHLAIRAGLGYGLFAAACHQRGETQRARHWWQQATLLMRPERLVADYPLLQPVAGSYPPAEWPWPAR